MPETAHQLALPLETHRNHYLFSDHYLNELLPRQAVWREAEAEAQQALEAITAKYHEVADALPHYSEAAAEQEWIRPVLDILGHVYHVQPALPDAAGTPDYAFFSDEAAKGAATPQLGTAAFWETALAVGDAKRWDRPLDRRILDGAPDAFSNANPCYQIDYYLRRTGCTWGLVSNGRRWRLFHRDSSYRLDVFYEVDLAQLIEQGDGAAFRYFYLFFRADAFRPDAEGRCWLDTVLAESKAYAVRVGDELTDRVYEALRLLAQGFLDYPTPSPTLPRHAGEGAASPLLAGGIEGGLDLPHIHDACLILLYRLLFLFYAESRGLLPLDNPSYRQQYSLKAIKEDIAAKLDAGVVFLPRKATLCDDLKTLFGIIYEGSEPLGVPAYNGGLFDPDKHPFLEEHTIGDRYLAQAIDLLARAEAKPGQGLSFVDYRDLSIRHMGSIYEGLLEYKLAYAAEEMAVVRRGKQEEFVPSSEVGKSEVMERIPAGQVYLVTDRGERKATGSYYTPDYIVNYIVEQTLGPLADAQAEAAEKEVEALKAKNRGAARRTKAYKDELARLQNSFADRILALNVLDPAMGSGHFLVEATDYLARRIVEAGVVSEALTDSNEESELSYWRRWVVERCIYGVDLNPLAVELAKLSLWLATVAKGKPLSFLDHHLRCGNSLIGARVADLQALPVRKKTRRPQPPAGSEPAGGSQLAMWDESAFTQDMFRVVGAMQQIQEYETADLVTVQEKERLFAETVERERRKWRDIADLWTAAYFGLELTPELYNACVQYAQGKPVLLQAAQAEALLAQAHQIWQDKRFFHWEIEFPEVFFDRHGQHKGAAAGFDAVVGNPPYVRGRVLPRLDKAFYSVCFETAFKSYDLYVLFVELGLKLLRYDGRWAMIIPRSFLTESYGEVARKYILDNTCIETIADFLGVRVFEDASVINCIPVLRIREPESQPDRNQVSIFRAASDASSQIPQGAFYGTPQYSFRVELTTEKLAVLEKVRAKAIDMGTLCYVSYSVAAHSEVEGKGKATYLSCEKTSDKHRPFIEGKELQRYSIDWLGRYLLYDPRVLRRPSLPALFESPKLTIVGISGTTGITAVFDEGIYYVGYPAICCTLKHHLEEVQRPDVHLSAEEILLSRRYEILYLLAILNSTLVKFLFDNLIFSTSQTIYSDDIRQLPIRRIEFTTPPEDREELVGVGIAEAAEWIEHAERASADSAPLSVFSDSKLGGWLDARLSAEPEQSDVVHDILARLAERMIEMHQQKQAEVKGFLGWLADYTGLPVDDWALKTNLRRYYEHDWAEMQRILKRNQRKLPNVDLDVDAYRNEPAQKIREAWETSMETLRPLLARIAATDRLIDLIVYRLYGLTAEEIAVVEGR